METVTENILRYIAGLVALEIRAALENKLAGMRLEPQEREGVKLLCLDISLREADLKKRSPHGRAL